MSYHRPVRVHGACHSLTLPSVMACGFDHLVLERNQESQRNVGLPFLSLMVTEFQCDMGYSVRARPSQTGAGKGDHFRAAWWVGESRRGTSAWVGGVINTHPDAM